MTSAQQLARWAAPAAGVAALATMLLMLAAFDAMAIHVLGVSSVPLDAGSDPPVVLVAAVAGVAGSLATAWLLGAARVLAMRGWAGWRLLRAGRRFERLLVGGEHVRVVPVDRVEAFCGGMLLPRVFVSRGALRVLGTHELQAVVAHEAHHARRRDPLRFALADALVEGWFLFPALGQFAQRFSLLSEVDADAAAVRLTRSSRPLAAALLAFEAAGERGAVAPERVDHLLGEASRARWPVGGLASAAGIVCVTIGLTIVLAVATGCTYLEILSSSVELSALLPIAVPGVLFALAIVTARTLGQRLGRPWRASVPGAGAVPCALTSHWRS